MKPVTLCTTTVETYLQNIRTSCIYFGSDHKWPKYTLEFFYHHPGTGKAVSAKRQRSTFLTIGLTTIIEIFQCQPNEQKLTVKGVDPTKDRLDLE